MCCAGDPQRMEWMMSRLSASQMGSVSRALERFEAEARAAMRAALAEAKSAGSSVAGEVHDLGEESVADELQAVNSLLAERHQRELREAARARERIASNEIDDCADCGGDIGLSRLLANPIAERCVDCETRREHTHAHAETPRL